MNTITIPTHLPNFINEVCKKLSIDGGEIVDIKIPTKIGENWLGQILDINLKGKNFQKQSVSRNVIFKIAPTLQLFREFHLIPFAYKREICMYNVVIPEFIKLQNDKNLKETFDPFAKCYHTCSDEEIETIALENMKTLGYRLLNHQDPVDFPHASLIMNALGKLHALSFAMRSQKPQIFREIVANIEESFFYSFRKSITKIVDSLGSKICDYLDNNSFVYEKFRSLMKDPANVLEKLFQGDPADKYNVVIHGDVEIRNMLFKYDDDVKTACPTQLCLLDWQLSGCASPVFDVSFFIWICTDKELRNQHYYELLDIYYKSLSKFLTQLGCNPEEIYPIDVFKDHLNTFSVFGLLTAIWILSVNLMNAEDIVNFDQAKDVQFFIDFVASLANKRYFIRISDVIGDFINCGYNLS